MVRKCPVCEKGEFVEVQDIVMEIEGYIFVVSGHRCTKCKEEFPYGKETEKVIGVAKRLGVWPEPLKLYRHLSKSAGGLMLRVPVDLERQMNLQEGCEVAIAKLGNKLVIEPL